MNPDIGIEVALSHLNLARSAIFAKVYIYIHLKIINY